MKVAHLSEPAEERVVFRDGLGVREWRDTPTGERVEWLHLDAAFASVELPLRERVSRLAKLQHVKFARILGLEPGRKGRGPILVSNHVPGTRLSDVLEMAGHGAVEFDPGAGLQVTREVLGGLAVLHDSRNVSHGALGPERVVLTSTGRVVMVEHVFAQALDRLQLPRHQLWRDWRVAAPTASGPARFDLKTDLAQAGLLVLAALLGRPLEEEDYPHRLRGLLPLVQDRLGKSPAAAIGHEVVTWLERLLPLESRRAFGSVREAQHAYETLVSGKAAAMGVAPARVKGVMGAIAAIATDGGARAGAATAEAPAAPAPTEVVAAPPAAEAPAIATESADDIDIEALLRLEAELEATSDEPAAVPVAADASLGALAQERLDLERQFADLVASVAPAEAAPLRLVPEVPATSEPLVDMRVRWSSMPVEVTLEESCAVDESSATAEALAEPLELSHESLTAEPQPVPEALPAPLAIERTEALAIDADATPETFAFERIVVQVPEEPAPAAAIDHVPADWWREALPWRDEAAGTAADAPVIELAGPACESPAEIQVTAASASIDEAVTSALVSTDVPAETEVSASAYVTADASDPPSPFELKDGRQLLASSAAVEPDAIPVDNESDLCGDLPSAACCADTRPVEDAAFGAIQEIEEPADWPSSPVLEASVDVTAIETEGANLQIDESEAHGAASDAVAVIDEDVAPVAHVASDADHAEPIAVESIEDDVVAPLDVADATPEDVVSTADVVAVAVAVDSHVQDSPSAAGIVDEPELAVLVEPVAEALPLVATPEMTEPVPLSLDNERAADSSNTAFDESPLPGSGSDAGWEGLTARRFGVDVTAVELPDSDSLVPSLTVGFGFAGREEDVPLTAAATLLARTSDEPATPSWRDVFLNSDVEPAAPAFGAQLASESVESTFVAGDRELDAPEAAPDIAESAPAPRETAPTQVVQPAVPDPAPEVVIVDGGHDGHAWDRLPSELPAGAAEESTPQQDQETDAATSADASVNADANGTAESSASGQDEDDGIAEEESAFGAPITSGAGHKKKRRRSRRKKMQVPELPPQVPAPMLPPVVESPTVTIDEPAAGAMPAPVPLVEPTAVAASEQAHDRGLAARPRSLLDREVPSWTPPADLRSFRPRPAPPVVTEVAPIPLPAPIVVNESVADVGVDASSVVRAGMPIDLPGPFEREIRAVGMPDVDSYTPKSGRSSVTSMADAMGPSTTRSDRQPTADTWTVPAASVGEARAGKNWRRVIAASVLIALFQGAAFAAWWWSQPGAVGTLVVQTAQDGVEVAIDGKVIGRTPFREEVVPGRHVLRLRHSGQQREMPVEISLGVVTTQALDWPAADGNSRGNLQVTSTPAGAEIFVNGESRGKAPQLLEGLTAGKHELTLRGDAGSVTLTATVIAGETTPLEVPIFAGWILVDAPVELSLLLNREKIGSSMDGQILMPPGTHRVQAVSDALGFSYSFTVTVEPGEVKRVAVRVPTAPLQVHDEPGTEVFVDGDRVGTLPATLRIPLGTHDVLVRRPDGSERRQTVTVRQGDTASM